MSDTLLGKINLQSPEYFWLLLVVPLLWWLLRLIPPDAVRRRFPSLRLLQNLPRLRPQTAFTPLWLLILRGAIMILFVLGFTSPIWSSGDIDLPPPDQPIMLLIDNCWSAVPNFQALRDKALSILEPLPPEQNIAVLVTCPATADPMISQGVVPVPRARALIHRIKLQDETADWARLLHAMQTLELAPIANVTFVSSGLIYHDDLARLLQELSAYDQVAIALPPESLLPVILSPATDRQKIRVEVQRFTDIGTSVYNIITRDKNGYILTLDKIQIPDGKRSESMALSIPPEALEEISTLQIPNMGMTAQLSWNPPEIPARIGLVANNLVNSFTNPNRYLNAALTDKTQLVINNWPALLEQNLPVIISAVPELPTEQLNAIAAWLQQGGRLIRFAGLEVPSNPDQLLPGRPMEMLYHLNEQFLYPEPLGLAAFPPDSPFQNLRFHFSPHFYQHWLINAVDLSDKRIWANYADQTPMILSKTVGQGESLLITTPPTPSGGNWIFSGAFPAMLEKMIARPTNALTNIKTVIETDQITVLNKNNIPDNIAITDLNNIQARIMLAPYIFILAILLWLADQALIITRFAGLIRAEK